MTYLQTHSRPYQRRSRIIGGVLAVLILLGIVTHIFAPHFFPAVFTSLASPFWHSQFSLSADSLGSPQSLLNENEMLKRQLAEADLRLSTVGSIETENRELKYILGRDTQADVLSTSTESEGAFIRSQSYILAAVLKHPPAALYDELIIDIGQEHGLSSTSLVYAPGNVLIGRVSDTLETSAKVVLFSSPGEKHNVFIGPSHSLAVAIGKGGGQYEAQIAHDVSVQAGDFVLNPSFGERPFGIVSEVLSDPTQLFDTVLFAPPVNIFELRWVLVKNI